MNRNNKKFFNLANKVALITGAGQNIGRGFAHALGDMGAAIAVIDKDKAHAETVCDELQSKNINAIAIQADVSQTDAVDNMLQIILKRWKKLDIAFNNAGICYGKPAEEITLEEWDDILQVNLRAVFYCCQAEARIMLKSNQGKIINTASIAGVLIPHPQKITTYNTAKAAVIHLTKSLAAEWADRGINVNCISPGVVRVPAIEAAELADWRKEALAQIPMKRFAEIEDLQAAAIFLASTASNYMTGHNLVIDGGHSLW